MARTSADSRIAETPFRVEQAHSFSVLEELEAQLLHMLTENYLGEGVKPEGATRQLTLWGQRTYASRPPIRYVISGSARWDEQRVVVEGSVYVPPLDRGNRWRTPSLASSAERRRLTTAVETPRSRAAADRLPDATTLENTAIS